MVSTNQHSLLIIGDPKGAVSTSALGRDDILVAADLTDASSLLGSSSLAAIGLVMSAFGRGLPGAIAEVHRQSPATPIFLLARMHEEPDARRYKQTCRNGSGPHIKDYLICPADVRAMVAPRARDAAPIPRSTPPASRVDNELIEQLVQMATEDPLTGLKNRRYADEFLRQAIERARRTSTPVSLVILDLDDFKHYNDTYGHKVGDSVLTQAAVFIRKCCRNHDIVARIGGDEFAVILWDVPSGVAHEADSEIGRVDDRRGPSVIHPDESHVIDRFRQQLIDTPLPLLGPDGVGVLTVSGGLASYPHDGKTADELFVAADNALLQAKRRGKNRIYLVGHGSESD